MKGGSFSPFFFNLVATKNISNMHNPVNIIFLVMLFCATLTAQSDQYFMHAQAKLDYNEPDSAVYYMNKAIEVKQATEYYMLRGEIYYDQGKYEDALKDFNMVESKSPGQASLYLAKIYAIKKDVNMSVNWLLIHLNSKYKDHKSSIRIDKAFDGIKNEKKYVDVWLKDWYSDYELALEGALYYVNNNELVNALEEYDNIFQTYTPTDLMYYQRANVYIALNDYGNAVTDLKNAIKLNTDNYDYYALRAYVLAEMKHYKKAWKDYNVAIEMNPEKPLDYLERGMVLYKMQLYQEAIKDISFYLKFYDRDEKAYYYAGLIYNELGDYSTALTYLNKLIDLNKGSVNYLIARVNAFEGLENYTQMLIDCNNALDLDPHNGLVFFKRGIAKLNLKDTDGACKDWENAVRNGYFDANEYIHSECK